MKNFFSLLVCISLLAALVLSGCSSTESGGGAESGEGGKLTVATVNNPDMKIMQKMTEQYFEKETGIDVEFVVLPENDLRKKVTEDVALGAGQFDIVTIGTYDAPIWAQNGWIDSLTPQFDELLEEEKAAYDIDDVFQPLKDALSYNDELYALPFYGESSMLYYNKEIFEEAGLEMPTNPTWDEVAEMAKTIKETTGTTGIIIRGLPGWGEMMAPLNTIVNAFGGSWYDTDWNAKLNSDNTEEAVQFYIDLLNEAGQPGATSTGFTEALTLMSTGKAGMWYDATVAAGFLNNPNDSAVAGKIGYAFAPKQEKDNNGWLWAWSLAVESASKNKEQAFKFIKWATSKEYIEKVGETEGWGVAPSGTRQSTYENSKYQEAAPFSNMVLESMQKADYENATVDPVPYKGIQYVTIPEFQQLGTEVSQQIAAAIAGQKTVDEAMEEAQRLAEKAAEEGGYKK
ncbi:ABC transporter substrate-binding protein [Bacillus taeanensis]|uniref:Sugar ABC transporter substrate-binding protein n=1 Tax=Bacillus taeanensis TaxID=273032 RepID=A0A366XSA1_9BACI|nr:sugar ABC transporter substrate-binding protein [Bacillus taeanensis]RBW69260.1 sugar ABC transporter substrate-binding protein [Bacillus taeanensis]